MRTAALAKIHDAKVLATVARHAVDAQTALEAVKRVTDQAELVAVATKTDHKDAGINALERAAESAASDVERRELLDGVAGRGKNKSVAKRARVLLQAMDEADAARKAAHEEWRKRVGLVMARLDAIASCARNIGRRRPARRGRRRVARADGEGGRHAPGPGFARRDKR